MHDDPASDAAHPDAALQPEAGVGGLTALLRAMPSPSRASFDRIFRVDEVQGHLRIPPAMLSWVESNFGSAEQVQSQRVIRVTNRVTLESTVFNPLRSLRPITRDPPSDAALISGKDDLCHVHTNTPEDVFGRVYGRYSVTASNLTKFEGFHGLVVFNEHNPLSFARAMVHDYLDVGQRWAELAHRHDSAAKYYLFLWNCLSRAGASLVHGHAQVSLGRSLAHGRIENLRRAAQQYRTSTGGSYFDDLVRAHSLVGCAEHRAGVWTMASLTPIKDHELVVIGQRVDDAFKDSLYEALAFYRDELGVTAFNLALCTPPLGDTEEDWDGFPVLARLVDRGDSGTRTSDIAAMELYASSVTASDPLLTMKRLSQHLTNYTG